MKCFRKCGFSSDAVNISLTGITVFKTSAQTSAPVTHSLLQHNWRRLCHDNSGVCLLLDHWLGHHWLRIPWLRIPWLRISWLSHRVPWLLTIGRRCCRSRFLLHCTISYSWLFRHVSRMLSYKFKRKREGIYQKWQVAYNGSKQLWFEICKQTNMTKISPLLSSIYILIFHCDEKVFYSNVKVFWMQLSL